ncbi:MAG: hypothetical protein L3V56_13395 [Candidatus Magnetoovum sp. WYHC-5]|nr:hypothetical protein [Candidatus Magnetoovum sp. WYHC-5]
MTKNYPNTTIEVSITNKEEFIHRFSLGKAIEEAKLMISVFFPDADVKEELYIDPENPVYKSLNISIILKVEDNVDMEQLIDSYDKLLEKFYEEVDHQYTKEISFYLEVLS